MQSFTAMPCDYRLAVRAAVYENGGEVVGYCDGALQLALPADRWQQNRLAEALSVLGLVGDDYATYYPLGTDNPPDTLRHHGIGTAACPRGTSPGYWKYQNFYVAGGAQ